MLPHERGESLGVKEAVRATSAISRGCEATQHEESEGGRDSTTKAKVQDGEGRFDVDLFLKSTILRGEAGINAASIDCGVLSENGVCDIKGLFAEKAASVE